MLPARTLSGVLAAGAAVLLLLVQFVPWATYEENVTTEGSDFGGFQFPGFDFDIKLTVYTWVAKVEANGDKETDSWYDGEGDDLALLRAGIPFLLLALLVSAAGAVLGLQRGGKPAFWLVVAAAGLTVLGTVLFAAGVHDLMDNEDYTWSASFYLALLASSAALAAAIVAAVKRDELLHPMV